MGESTQYPDLSHIVFDLPSLRISHIPGVPGGEGGSIRNDFGRLRVNMVRQNAHSTAIIDFVQVRLTSSPNPNKNLVQGQFKAPFDGPVHYYLKPKFYAETKPLSVKLVTAELLCGSL
jgi:hypothetical protein